MIGPSSLPHGLFLFFIFPCKLKFVYIFLNCYEFKATFVHVKLKSIFRSGWVWPEFWSCKPPVQRLAAKGETPGDNPAAGVQNNNKHWNKDLAGSGLKEMLMICIRAFYFHHRAFKIGVTKDSSFTLFLVLLGAVVVKSRPLAIVPSPGLVSFLGHLPRCRPDSIESGAQRLLWF